MKIEAADCTSLEESEHLTQIAHLKRWIKRVYRDRSQSPTCDGMAKLVELGLLKYGKWLSQNGLMNAFSGLGNTEEFQCFALEHLAPKDKWGSVFLELLAEGQILMTCGYRNGKANFIYRAAAERSPTVQ